MHEAASALSASQHRRDVGHIHNEAGTSAWWRSGRFAAHPVQSRYSSGYCSPLRPQPFSTAAAAPPVTPDDASTAGSRWYPSPLSRKISSEITRNHQPHTPPVLPPQVPNWSHPRKTTCKHQDRSAHPPSSEAARQWDHACRMLRTGEALAAARPLLYVTLLQRFGPRSWLPWTIALACEAIALTLTTVANQALRKVLPFLWS